MKSKKRPKSMSIAGVHKRNVLLFLPHSPPTPTPLRRSFTSSSPSPPRCRPQQQSLRQPPPPPRTLADFVRRSLDFVPETVRRFWRASALGSHDFHQIVLGFIESGDRRRAPVKARLLWDLLQWASDDARCPHFHLQLPAACRRALASLLVRSRMFPEAEFLVSVQADGACDFGDVCSDVVRGYVALGDLHRSMALYRRARARGISLSVSCFEQLLHLLVESGDTHRHSFLAVYSDMVELGIARDDGDRLLRFAVRILCRDRKVLEAVALIRRVAKPCGVLRNPVPLVDLIANAYCNERDFDALIAFLEDVRFTPSPPLCNKIISSICEHSGANMAWIILQKLEVLGFRPDSRTFAIFICWSCKQKKLRDAFIFLSEMPSRNLKPDIHAYNALISGLFREGMWKYAREVFTDMSVDGVTPEMSTTFRLLLAGYSKERKFDEARMVLQEMVNCGMTTMDPWEDALSKVFTLLGFNSLHVKIKRINDMKLQKAEFYDSIGNGLFLHTDDGYEYDKSLAGIIENGLIPDFDHFLLEECRTGNIQKVIGKKEEALQYAQKLSPQTYSTLLRVLSTSSYDRKRISGLFEEMHEFFDKLEHQTLNLLVQMLSKKGLLLRAGLVLDVLFQRKLPIENKTFSSLVVGSYRRSNQKRFEEYWEVAQRSGWLPRINDFNVFVSQLLKYGMLKEVLCLFQGMTRKYPHAVAAVHAAFLKELCISGSFGIENAPNGQSARKGQLLDYKVYENLKKDLCEVKLSEALEVLDVLLGENIPVTPAVCQLVMPFIIGPGNLEKTMVLKRVFLGSQSQVSLSVSKVLVGELCKVGNVTEASHLLLEMMMAGLTPDGDILNMIADGYAKASNSIKAYELLCFMLKMDMDLTLSTYRSLIRLNIVKNQLLDCLNLIKMFIKDGDSRSITFYNILIFHLFHAKKAQVVEIILDEMQMKQLILDHVSYNFLVFGYYICGNTKKSVEFIKFMLLKDLMPSSRSFRIAINHLCVHFSLNEALDLRKVMHGWGIKHGSMIQNALIDSLFSQGSLKEACQLLDQLQENGLVSNNICYDNLIRKFCKHQMVDKAIDLLNFMIKKGNIPSEATYNSIIDGLLVQKKFDMALDFLAEMQNKNFQLSLETCIALVKGLCRSGRIDDASMLLETTVHSGLVLPSNIIYLVINRYNAENNLHKAMDLLHKMEQSGYLPDFETHWSLVSSLSDTSSKHTKRKGGFLSNFLSRSGIPFQNHNVKSTGSNNYSHRKK